MRNFLDCEMSDAMLTFIIVFISLALFLLIPVGIDGGYGDGALILGLKIGPFNVNIFPGKKSKRFLMKALKKRDKDKKKRVKKVKDEKKLDLSQILDIINIGVRALGRFRRRLRIDYLRFHCRIATDDPFNTMLYSGAAAAAVSAVFPLLEDCFNIRERDFGIAPDFLSDKTGLGIWLTATLHILDLFYIAFAFGVEFLIFYIKTKKGTSKKPA